MESRMREIRTYGLTRGKSHRRQRRGVGLYSTYLSCALPSASCCSSCVLSCLWKSRIIHDVRGPRQRAFWHRRHIMRRKRGGGAVICNYAVDRRSTLCYHAYCSRTWCPETLWDGSGFEKIQRACQNGEHRSPRHTVEGCEERNKPIDS